MSLSKPMIVDTIDKVVTVPESLFKFLCTVPQGWKDIETDLVPAGRIKVRVKAYSTVMEYWVTKTNLVAEIEIGATKMSSKFFKLTVHAGHCSTEQFQLFQRHLLLLAPDMEYAKLFATARVSRIELASDSLSHAHHTFIPFRPYTTCSAVWHDKKDGSPGTLYIGSKASDLRFRVYDKKKQLEEKKKLFVNWATQTRIEAVIRSPGCSGSELAAVLENPFGTLAVADLETAKKQSDDPAWQKFLSLCLAVGSPMALTEIAKSERKLYRSRLTNAAAPWWKPDQIWSKLPQALERIAPAYL